MVGKTTSGEKTKISEYKCRQNLLAAKFCCLEAREWQLQI